MKNNHNIGKISFSEEGYRSFTEKSKEEQIEQVYNSLSPKDYVRAENLLKHIPHGNISSGNVKEVEQDNRNDAPGGGGGHNSDNSKAAKRSKGN